MEEKYSRRCVLPRDRDVVSRPDDRDSFITVDLELMPEPVSVFS